MTPASTSPLRTPALWLAVLWGLLIGVLAGALDLTERELARRARAQTMLLMPAADTTPEQRAALQRQLTADPAVLGAQWLSPAAQTRRMAGRYGGAGWEAMFPDDEAWLPWLLEVGFRDPLDNPDALNGFAAARGQEAQWRVVLWEGERLGAFRRARTQLRATLGMLLALALLGGMAGLVAAPPPARPRSGAMAWGAAKAGGGVAAVAAAASLAGAPVDARAAVIGIGLGIALAGLVAPMIRRGADGATDKVEDAPTRAERRRKDPFGGPDRPVAAPEPTPDQPHEET